MAAIRTRELNPKCSVTILESAAQPLRKVKISGGGRCNVTHHCFEASKLVDYYPRGGKKLRSLFLSFGPRELVEWFLQAGVRLKTEADGRMFPVSDSSQTIIDCLLEKTRKLGVEILPEYKVLGLNKVGSGFELPFSHAGQRGLYRADRVLLATGGNSGAGDWLRNLGHKVIDGIPSLFTFKIDDPRLEGLAGISVPSTQVTLGSTSLRQEGATLITHWGLSGPAVLKLSSWGARELANCQYSAKLLVNWLHPRKYAEVRKEIQLMCDSPEATRACGNTPMFGLPARLWQKLLGPLAPHAWRNLSEKNLENMIGQLRQCEFAIAGKGIFKEEFVTAGGLDLEELDWQSLESRHCPGLFVAGELLDIDAVTGGFNFQSAWTTGWVAAKGLAK